MIQRSEYFSVANDTKWRELRIAMLDLDQADQPDFRCKDLENGVLGARDGEWYYHRLQGGWEWNGLTCSYRRHGSANCPRNPDTYPICRRGDGRRFPHFRICAQRRAGKLYRIAAQP